MRVLCLWNLLDAMKHPSEDHYVFCAAIFDDVVDCHISKSQSVCAKKYPLLSELFEFPCIDIDDKSKIHVDFDFDVDY